MARVKLWRLAALLIPALGLMELGRNLLIGGWTPPTLTLRSSVQRAVATNRDAIHLARELDSLGRVPQRQERIGGVVLATVGDTTSLHMADLRRELRREQTGLPDRGAGTPWAVVLTGARLGTRGFSPERVKPGQWSPCIMVAYSAADAVSDTTSTWPRLLGQCAFAAYGPPGAGITSWIERLALRPGVPPIGGSVSTSRRDATGRMVIDVYDESRQPYLKWDESEILMFGCRDGNTADCRRLLNMPVHRSLRGDLLWWLRPKYGNEAFARFWRSGGDIDAAARAGFGQPLGVLAGQFLRDRIVVVNDGPTPPANWPLAAGWVLFVAIGLSLGLARRRAIA